MLLPSFDLLFDAGFSVKFSIGRIAE